MIIIPAIDVHNGQCVRLAQGDFRRVTVYSEDPVAMAGTWQGQGAERIHVVDLDGSLAGSPRNESVIRNIVRQVGVPIQVGGGIRERDTIAAYLGMGVSWVILGTAALQEPEFVREVSRDWPGKIILGIDAHDGRVAVQGWTETTALSALDIARRYEDCALAAIVYTDIKRDGMETGVNLEATKALAEAVPIPVIASGGVAGMGDIERLLSLVPAGVMGVIVGRAIYTGALSLPEAIQRVRDFASGGAGRPGCEANAAGAKKGG